MIAFIVALQCANAQKVADIIKSYVEDYRQDRYASEAMQFGIEVPKHGAWTVNVTGKKVGTNWEVLLKEGLPKTPTFVYKIEYPTLVGIHKGKINALTAQGKAFAGDYTPMSIYQMKGYKPTMVEYAKINPFSFHFWTRGYPEIIPFGESTTRRAHGSNFTVFYYEKGLRTAWYRVLPKERVRDNPREQAAPFPMLIVAIKGTTKGIVGGKNVSLEKGQTIFIPPNVAHKWWNDTKEPTEAILIMFGKGA
ncbi:hypothetical protein BKI52_21695 [marine bacterium AO1-C]|nr:hypothetical protein BKI52_21695 [marine bacterium AO1-C]